MSIVNNILNKVDLNTTKYTEKLRRMGKDTRKQSKGIGKDFAAMGAAWKNAIAAIATGAMAGAVSKELIATEKSVAAFIQSTGSLADARAQFEMLQQAARDTIQPFDALKAAALDLRRNGITPTAEQLKTFSQIAYGSGQSIETVAGAFTGAIQGNVRGLKQLGITAQDTGDKLRLTYKGTTTEIEKNTGALADYFAEIGRQNEGVLDYLQGGLTGAVNKMENAWGDFIRAIGESGFGDLIREMVSEAATALDDITSWINENQEPIKAFFNSVIEGWRAISDATKNAAKFVTDTVSQLWEDSGLASATGIKSIADALSQFFNFARAGFLMVAKAAETTWERIKGTASAHWEGWKTTVTELSFSAGQKAFSDAMDGARKNVEELGKTYDTAINLVFSDIDKNLKDIQVSRIARTIAAGVQGAQKPELPSFEFPGVKAGGGKSRGGGTRAPKPEKDGWPEYYKSLQNIARQGYSDIEKLRAEHGDRIAELNRQFAESQSATEAEYLAAKKVLDDDYLREYKAKQQEARDFLRELKNDEMLDLDNEYRMKLEKLREFHEQGLIAEQEYQDGLADIRKDYDSKREKKGLSKDRQKEIDGIHDMASGINTLSEAFGNLTQGMSESSTAYKALFVLQKSFAVASATMNAFAAWMEALNTKPFIPAGLAAYANAVALTTGILGQLKSVTMHDKGGRIPAGGLGIVGEYGPEIVEGPANVTSRRKTAAMAEAAFNAGTGAVTVNLYEDASRAGQTESETAGDGERIINIFVSNIRRGGQMAKTLENTYQIRRYGA